MFKLKPGDKVEIIAPASRCSDKRIQLIKETLAVWQLQSIVAEDIFGDDLLCANSDAMRFKHLQNALLNPETKVIVCARGGYGSMRLLPELKKLSKPVTPKILIGMSDITALLLFLEQHWGWPTLHGALAPDIYSSESIESIKKILFAEIDEVRFANLVPLNQAAKVNTVIESKVSGGNLCLIQTSIGTAWQLDAKDKIVLIEEVGERGYRVDRMLEHLQQAHLFKNAKAILFGDFLEGKEPDGSSLLQPVLNRFAESLEIPVLQVEGIGHGQTNLPIPFGTETVLQLGDKAELRVKRFS